MKVFNNPTLPAEQNATAAAKFEHRKRVLRHLEAQDPDGAWEIYWFGLGPNDWNAHFVPKLDTGEGKS